MEIKTLVFFSLWIPFIVTLVQIFRGDKYSFVIPFLLVHIFQSAFFLATFPARKFSLIFSIAMGFIFYKIYKDIGYSRHFKKSHPSDERVNKLFYSIIATISLIILTLFYFSIRSYLIEQFGVFWMPFYLIVIFTLLLFFTSIWKRKI